MNCSISPENQRLLRTAIFADLKDIVKNNKPFNIKDYITEYYNNLSKRVSDDAKALDYVRLIPQFILQATNTDINLLEYLVDKGLDFNQLSRVMISFSKSLDNVKDYVTPEPTTIDEIKEIKTSLPIAQEATVSKPTVVNIFDAISPFMLATTGSEAISSTPGDPGFNVQRPSEKPYRNTIDALLNKLASSTDGKIVYPVFGEITLTAMAASKIPEADLRPDTFDIDPNDPKRDTLEKVQAAHNEGIVLAVTDNYGSFQQMNPETGEPDINGKIMYYVSLNPENYVSMVDGEPTIVDSDGKLKRKVDSLARFKKISKEEAKDIIKEQVMQLYRIRKLIQADPDKKIVMDITGGSFGYSPNDYSILTDIKQLNFGDAKFEPFIEIEKGKIETTPGFTYFYFPNYNKPIEIKKPLVTPEHIKNLIIDVLTKDVKMNINGKLVSLPLYKKQEIVDTYLHTHNTGIQVSINIEGRGVVKLKGNRIVPETAAIDLENFFKDPSNGKNRLNILDKKIGGTFVDFSIAEENGNLVLKETVANYNDFIKENFQINYQINAENKIVRLNSYLNFVPKNIKDLYESESEAPLHVQAQLPAQKDDIKESSAETQSGPADNSIEDLLKDIENDPNFDKLDNQMDIKAVKAQIDAALAWYESSPLKKHFPFQVLFNAVNIKNSKSIATWSLNGIRLYKGSDYTDLYHEAWHGFSQTFLTKEEKTVLYNHVKDQPGSFKNYKGDFKLFKDADFKEIEEYLAEKFREFMLGKSTESAKVNSIFRRILNFLKALFGKVTYDEGVALSGITPVVQELYEKLRVGNLTEYTFSAENVMFNNLASGIASIDNKDTSGINELSYQNSKTVVSSLDSLISEAIDVLNKRNNTNKFTSNLLRTEKGISYAYKYAYLRLKNEILKDLEDKLSKETNPSAQQPIQKNIDLIKWTLRNFGNIETPSRDIKQGKGVIYYHILKTDIIGTDDRKEIFLDRGDLSETEAMLKAREAFDRAGNESSLLELASKQIVYIIKGLYKYSDGKPVYNTLGVKELNEFNLTWKFLAKELQDILSAQDMYDKLVTLSGKGNPIAAQLLDKIGTFDTNEIDQFSLWTKFWQTFNKYRVSLMQVNLQEETNDEGDPSFSIRIGASSADFMSIGRNWRSQFKSVKDNKYIAEDLHFNNYLRIGDVLKDFSLEKTQKNPYEFLKAIGITFTDTEEIRNALKQGENARAVFYTRARLFELINRSANDGGSVVIKDLTDIFKEYPANNYHSDNLRDANSRWKSLQQLEAEMGNSTSNFMVSNAAGNSQYEHTLNNSLTAIINAINKSASYDELIKLPYMSYLDIERNPFARSSKWLNSIFEMDNVPGKRFKRKVSNIQGADYVSMNLRNLSGAAFVSDQDMGSGIESAKADRFTKFLMDFHLTVIAGTPELMRHSDKGTSYTVFLTKVNKDNLNPNLYIDNYKFVPVTIEGETFIPGQEYVNENFLIDYLQAEVDRIKIIKDLKAGDVRNFDFAYLKAGEKFQIFDDIIESEDLDLKTRVLHVEGPLKTYFNTPEGSVLRTDLFKAFNKYFNAQVKETVGIYNKSTFTAGSIIGEIRRDAVKKGVISKGTTIPNNRLIKALLTSYVYNSWIHNIESMNILYNDIALYNHAKEEFHKRNAGLSSTGEIYRSDNEAIRFVNQTLGRPYAKSKNLPINNLAYDGSFNSAVFEDDIMQFRFIDDYKKAFKEYYTKIYPDLSEEQIDSKVNSALKPYTDMKEGDAQGWVTFDFYRILLNLQGTWLKEQEDLYQDIIQGKNVDSKDIAKFFPVKKLQYFGAMKTDGLPLTAFHKFSLYPLIPNVIKGTNLEQLHNQLIKNNQEYALFKSGSKVSTISYDGKSDAFYTNKETREINLSNYSNNPLYLNYLKDQLETGDKFKKVVTFPTQMRKLIEEGLIEAGVPIDFDTNITDIDTRVETWNKLTEKEKLAASPYYTLVTDYEKTIIAITESKKEELLADLNWKVNPITKKPEGNIENLLKFVVSELERQDMANHEIDFIKLGSDGKLQYDLSLSYSAERIERLLNALITKRLVKQKVTGESLIQLSTAGFEKFRKPTEEEKAEYKSDDLPFYRLENGKTQAMKVKIALQGAFRNLLMLDDVVALSEKDNISRLEALNILIKSDAWLDTNDNRRYITMLGSRIPVQGLNSMEFMEVYEFLPSSAGNVIISPSAIVAKTGSDFDIDKMTVMMPNIRLNNGVVVLQNKMTKSEIRKQYDKLKEAKLKLGVLKDFEGNVIQRDSIKVHRTEDGYLYSDTVELSRYNKLFQGIFGYDLNKLDDETIEQILKEEKMPTIEEFTRQISGTRALENQLFMTMREILQLPVNFINLIRPNDTDIVKPLADSLEKYISSYNPKAVVNGKTRTINGKSSISPTRVFEIGYNLYKHNTNNIGKQTLGIGAVDNTFNTILNRVGAYLSPEYMGGSVKSPFKKRQMLFLPHNTFVKDGQKVISLSHLFDKNNKVKISDVISQLINGWVDIAKDAWIFNVQGNKELTPSLLFMVQAGVPFDTAVYFLSQPLIKEYVEGQLLAKSTFAKVLGTAPSNPNFFRIQSRTNVLMNSKNGFNISPQVVQGRDAKRNIYNLTVDYTNRNKDTAFVKDRLEKKVKEFGKDQQAGVDTPISADDRAVFLHFLEIEEMANAVRDIKMNLNVDTARSANLFEALLKDISITRLKEDARFPKGLVEKIIGNPPNNYGDTPITSFFIQKFQQGMLGNLLSLREHPELNRFLFSIFRNEDSETNNIIDKFWDEGEFANEFKNDILSFIFQNKLYKFDIDNLKSYKGIDGKEVETIPVRSLVYPAIVKDNKLYYSKTVLAREYVALAAGKNILGPFAKVNNTMFNLPRDYYHYVIEREYLRSIYPYPKMEKLSEFKDRLEIKISKIKKDREILEQETYEEMLRDMALDNIYNPYKLFKSNTSFADQFEKIKRAHPELTEQYDLIKQMGITVSKGRSKNLKLSTTKLTGDEITLYNENLQELSDPSNIKLNAKNPEEIKEITDFFKKLPIYAFLQSGLNTRSALSLTRVVDQKLFLDMITEDHNYWLNNMSKTMLETYFSKFKQANSNWTERIRFKNYGVTNIDPLKTLGAPSQFDFDSAGNLLYTGLTMKPSVAKKYIEDNPDHVFVFNDAPVEIKGVSTGGADSKDWVFRRYRDTTQNAVGLPTRKKFSTLEDAKFSDYVTPEGSRTINPQLKEMIDNQINKLKELQAQGKKLVFIKEGYGQYMIGVDEYTGKFSSNKAKAKNTFIYLSERLAQEFDYINPNFENASYDDLSRGADFIQQKQPIKDSEVLDMLKHCMLK